VSCCTCGGVWIHRKEDVEEEPLVHDARNLEEVWSTGLHAGTRKRFKAEVTAFAIKFLT